MANKESTPKQFERDELQQTLFGKLNALEYSAGKDSWRSRSDEGSSVKMVVAWTPDRIARRTETFVDGDLLATEYLLWTGADPVAYEVTEYQTSCYTGTHGKEELEDFLDGANMTNQQAIIVTQNAIRSLESARGWRVRLSSALGRLTSGAQK